jgi:hypothetical protein
MKLTIQPRLLFLLFIKLSLVHFALLLDFQLGLPMLTCFFLLWFSRGTNQPIWIIIYLMLCSLMFSSIFSLSWLITLGVFGAAFLFDHSMRFSTKQSRFSLLGLSIFISVLLFVVAGGMLSGGVVLYGIISLAAIIGISQWSWFSRFQSQSWYIR